MGEYTLAALAAPVVVVALELAWLRTGLLREGRYWLTLVIALAFMVPVDGALTRGPEPVVSYSDAATSGLRWPGSIPVEDFGFGFALVTAALLAWRCQLRRRDRAATAVGTGAGRHGRA